MTTNTRTAPLKRLPALLAVFALAGGCRQTPTGKVQGYVEGEFVYVASPLAGKLEKLVVQRGAAVKRDDLLFALEAGSEIAVRDEAVRRLALAHANLDDARRGRRPSEIASLEAQLAQARAAAGLSTSELARQEQLRKEGAISANEVDRARATDEQNRRRTDQLEADLQTARLGAREDQIAAADNEVHAREAALAHAEWELAHKRQSAAADAIVFDTLYREGEWVGAGKPVVVLLPPGNVKVRAYVPETVVGALHIGDTVTVAADGDPQPHQGRLTFVSPQAEYTPPVLYSRDNRGKLVFLVEARFDAATAALLHPGQPVDLTLPGAR
jgi:HlyD family secretion protein